MSSENIRLTPRDLAILKSLVSWKVLSLEQIRQAHFAGLSVSVSSERITKLQRVGLLCKQRVGILVRHGHPKEIGSVVTLTSKSFKACGNADKINTKNLYTRPLNTAELYHDLLLFDLAKKLQEKHADCKIRRGESVRSSAYSQRRVPDLVMNLDGKNWAIELELTAKSTHRYREILASYLTSLHFERVLYVVRDEVIRSKIERVLLTLDPGTHEHSATNSQVTIAPISEYFCEISPRKNIQTEQTNLNPFTEESK